MAVVVAVGVAVLATPAHGQSGGAAGDACALPTALLDAGETKAARAEYVKLLRGNPTLECAQEGLAQANGAGAYAQKPPKTDIEKAEDLCEVGIAKKNAGAEAEAAKDFQKALDLDPAADCAQELDEINEQDRIERTESALDDIAKVLGLGIAALLLALLAATLFATILRPLRRWLVWVPVIGRVMRPQVRLEAFDDGAAGDQCKGAGAALTARTTERLHRYRQQASGTSSVGAGLDTGALGNRFADLATKDNALNDALEKAAGIDDRAKVVAAVVTLFYAVLPSKRFTVSAVLDPPTKEFVSATVRIEQGTRLVEAMQVRGPRSGDVVGGDDFLTLAEPIATWIQYEVANALIFRRSRRLPIDAPESFALAREAVEQQLAGDYGAALGLYERAVSLYRANWAAHVGQAATEARLGNFDRAIATLEKAVGAREASSATSERPARHDGNYYRLAYQLHAQRLNAAIAAGQQAGRPHVGDSQVAAWSEEAARFGDEVALGVSEIGSEIEPKGRRGRARRWLSLTAPWPKRAKRRRLHSQREELWRFLSETVAPCTAVVAGGFEVYLGKRDPDRRVGCIQAGREKVKKAFANGDGPVRTLSYRAWFDRACFEATDADVDPGSADLDVALASLRRAFTLAVGSDRVELVSWAKRDPSLAPLRSARRREFLAAAREFGPA